MSEALNQWKTDWENALKFKPMLTTNGVYLYFSTGRYHHWRLCQLDSTECQLKIIHYYFKTISNKFIQFFLRIRYWNEFQTEFHWISGFVFETERRLLFETHSKESKNRFTLWIVSTIDWNNSEAYLWIK